MNKNSGPLKQNVGSTLMILQQQYNHHKKLEQIYSRTTGFGDYRKFKEDQIRVKRKFSKKNTKDNYQKEKHLKNIKYLLENITREKTMRERRKDQNDFFAYPALFFRNVTVEVPQKKRKTMKKKRINLTAHQQDDSGAGTMVSIEKIRQNLPVLTDFDQSQLQQWADAVNRMIINYNIMRKDELLSFAVKVLSLLPHSCPLEFKQVAQKWMDDICSQKVEVW